MSPLLDRIRDAVVGRPQARWSREPDDRDVLILRSVASHLLAYPDAELLERLPMLRAAVAELPQGDQDRLSAVMGVLGEAAADPSLLQDLQMQYVETFDQRRRGCMYLSYFSHGDTRRRGMALLGIKQEMREAGFEIGDDELPDHLAVVLEFAGTIDPMRGDRILRLHRPGIELLRLHLRDKGSPWLGVLEAVSATLPPLGDDEDAAVAALIAEGPADEEVGLSGYGVDDGPPASAPMAWDPLGSAPMADEGAPGMPCGIGALADALPDSRRPSASPGPAAPESLPFPTIRPDAPRGGTRD